MGGICFITAIFLVFLPKTLPGARARNLERLHASADQGKYQFELFKSTLRPALKENPFSGKIEMNNKFNIKIMNNLYELTGMKHSMRRLFHNNIFVAMTVNQMFFWASVVPYFIFVSKYIEQHFGKSASEANRDLGIIIT